MLGYNGNGSRDDLTTLPWEPESSWHSHIKVAKEGAVPLVQSALEIVCQNHENEWLVGQD